jgi:hypothetical protein
MILGVLTDILMMWVLPPRLGTVAVLSIFGAIPLRLGFAFVLYSRLHFVYPQTAASRRKLRWVLVAIILITISFSVPGVVVTLLGSSGSFLVSYRMYKVVLYFDIVFVLEDIFLESLYISYFRRYLKDIPAYAKQDTRQQMRRIFYLLLAASVIVLICDIVGVVLLCMKILLLRYTIYTVLFGVKLNAEFFVLNRLVDVTELKSEILRQGNLSESLVEEGSNVGITRRARQEVTDTNKRSGPGSPERSTVDAREEIGALTQSVDPEGIHAHAPTPGPLRGLHERPQNEVTAVESREGGSQIGVHVVSSIAGVCRVPCP